MVNQIPELSLVEFYHRYREKSNQAKIPTYATIELTYGCNLRCVHCYNPTHVARNELMTEEILRILDQLVEAGTYFIQFTGGELFTRKDCFEILEYAKGKRLQMVISTNATMITPELAERLEGVAPAQVKVSLYGATPVTYERVTRVPGSFERFLSGVRLLRERRINMSLTSIILTLNVHEFHLMRQLTESLGLKFQYMLTISPRVDHNQEPLQYRVDPVTAQKIWETQVGEPAVRRGETLDEFHGEEICEAGVRGPFNCQCGKSKIVVTPYGKMNLCLAVYEPQYDLRAGSVADGWEKLVSYVAHAQASERYECPDCPVRAFCDRSPGASWLEMGDPNACIPYQKDTATLRKVWYNKARERSR